MVIKGMDLKIVIFYLFEIIVVASTVVRYELQEEAVAGYIVGNIATDADLIIKYGSNVMQILRYNFLPEQKDPDVSELFMIEENTGIIRTINPIDREKECEINQPCTKLITIAVTPSDYFEIINVVIEILDINDNFPIFKEPSISITIPETADVGYKVRLPSAQDLDSGNNGIKHYELLSNSQKFKLEITEPANSIIWLNLVLVESLDREDISVYNLKLIASDGGLPKNSGTLEIFIEVGDSNDNSPKFKEDAYLVSIKENTPINTTIVSVKANDDDIGKFGKITYSIADENPIILQTFGIHPEKGRVYLKNSLDFEKRNSYNLLIMAIDGGANSDPAFATIDIFIEDLNDNAPIISINVMPPAINPEISESATVGSFVAHVSVSDPDSGNNGDFSCSLDTESFALDALRQGQYKIISNQRFDREIQSIYHFQIICVDFGDFPQMSSRELSVNVLDENDNKPVFSQSVYSIQVPENNNPSKTVLAQLNATDRDSGINSYIEYFLEPKMTDYFSINRHSGVLKSNIVFDYERAHEYILFAMARDRGVPSFTATASVIITILDENDAAPLFLKEFYSFKVYENQPAGFEIGYVTATDTDASEVFHYCEYSIRSSQTSPTFSIDTKTGMLRTNIILDREHLSRYELEIVAVNVQARPMISGTTQVLIEVEDENDNNPVLDFPSSSNFTVHISSQTPKGVEIGYLQAHDLDTAENAKLFFHLPSGNEDKIFKLHPGTGVLRTNSHLWDHANRLFELKVKVMDEGHPPLSSAVHTLCIYVNSTIPYLGDISKSALFLGDYNLVIMIAITFGSFVIIVVLLIAICMVICKSKNRSNMTPRSYKMDELKNMEKQKNIYEKETVSHTAKEDIKSVMESPEHHLSCKAQLIDRNNAPVSVTYKALKAPCKLADTTSSDSGVSNTDSAHLISEDEDHFTTGSAGYKFSLKIFPPQVQSKPDRSTIDYKPPMHSHTNHHVNSAHLLGVTGKSPLIKNNNMNIHIDDSHSDEDNHRQTLPKFPVHNHHHHYSTMHAKPSNSSNRSNLQKNDLSKSIDKLQAINMELNERKFQNGTLRGWKDPRPAILQPENLYSSDPNEKSNSLNRSPPSVQDVSFKAQCNTLNNKLHANSVNGSRSSPMMKTFAV